MTEIKKLDTERLLLTLLQTEDADFIQELVNTSGWLQFIGDRNVHSPEDAAAYIQRILGNASVCYLVVRLKGENIPAGIITFIQRDYLEHPDIGFAFLPAFSKKGYAFESAVAVLDYAVQQKKYSTILAITVPGNKDSVRLLTKLGLQFDKEIERENEKLLVYATAINPAIHSGLKKHE